MKRAIQLLIAILILLIPCSVIVGCNEAPVSSYSMELCGLAGAEEGSLILDREDALDVGIKNFCFDLIISDGSDRLSFSDAKIDFTVTKGGIVLDKELYALAQSRDRISFDESLVGETVSLNFIPKKTPSNALSLRVKLNAGVNVYTDDELRAAYTDLSIHEINIQRNIVVKLLEDDYLPNHGQDFQSITLSDGTELAEVNVGAPINDYYHSAYARITADSTDRMVIHGNSFFIDGSQLPFIDNRIDGRRDYVVNGGYYIANTQIGVFLYRNSSLDEEKARISQRYNGGTLTIENLLIKANSDPALENKRVSGYYGESVELVLRSAGYNGIVCRGGTVDLHNVTLENAVQGILLDGGADDADRTESAVILKMNACRIRGCWAIDCYAFNIVDVTISHSELDKTGCAAIMFDEVANPLADSNLVSKLQLDYDTVSHVTNWVSAEEEWFASRGWTDTTNQVMYGVATALQTAGVDLTNLSSDGTKMNLLYLVRAYSPYDYNWSMDPQGVPTIHVNCSPTNGIASYVGEDDSPQYLYVLEYGSGRGGMTIALLLYPKEE